MKHNGLIRKVLIGLVILIALAVCLLVFQLIDYAFSAWGRLQAQPFIFRLFYLLLIGGIAFIGTIAVWRVWTIGKGKKGKKALQPLSFQQLLKKLSLAKSQGLDTSDLEAELEALNLPPVHLEVAFFGKISTGKSALIQTLIPNAEIETSIIGGSTAVVEKYHYQDKHLDIELWDMPGTQQAEALFTQEQFILDTARKVHVVVYVIDQDLTQTDWDAIQELKSFQKPIILAFNKTERYTEDELKAIKNHLVQRLPDVQVVSTNSVHWKKIRKNQSDGSFTWVERLAGGEVSELLSAFLDLSAQKEALHDKKRQAIMRLAHENLEQRLRNFRRERAEQLVKSYSRKAMLGGVAAVGPGTDVIIQGYLGVSLFQQLGKLYEVQLKEMDLQILIDEATAKASTKWTLTLALAGNICKAFPGVGTVLGGASHAVAYGLIFESLGKAGIEALEAGQYQSAQIITYFEEQLNHDLENRAKSLVKNIIN